MVTGEKEKPQPSEKRSTEEQRLLELTQRLVRGLAGLAAQPGGLTPVAREAADVFDRIVAGLKFQPPKSQ